VKYSWKYAASSNTYEFPQRALEEGTRGNHTLLLSATATLNLSDFLFPNKFYDFFSEDKKLEILVLLV
jgi:hypothetical protein